MKTAIVILNWNGKKWLEQFLPPLIKHSEKEADIIIADNASADSSIDFIQTHFPSIQIISLEKNYGFAEGYNRALQQVNADLYVLLNNDVHVSPNWLSPMISHFKENKDVAICQPKIKAYHQSSHFEYAGASGGWIDGLGYPFCRGRMINHTEEDTNQYNDSKDIFWASGACFIIRSDIFWKAGGFDAAYFAHMEEIDLCWRIQNMGYRILAEPASVVYHVGGGSLEYQHPQKTFLNFRNSLYTLYKNLPFPQGLLLILFRLELDGLAGFIYFISGKFRHTWAIVRAHWNFFFSIPRLQKQRKQHSQRSLSQLKGVYKGSILWQYFIRRKKTFTDVVHSQ